MDFAKLLGMPEDWSANGREIDSLMFWLHVLMAVLFVGWGAFFLISLWRFRRSASPKANYHGVRSHASSYIEVAVAVVEVLLLVGISIPVWARRIDYPAELEAKEPPLRINVVAEQFSWSFHYPGPDEKFGPTKVELVTGTNLIGLDKSHPDAEDDVVSIRSLHLPVDRPIEMKLTSKDVIHGFFIPVLRIKTDTIPGQMSSLWFKAVKTNPSVVNPETGKEELVEAHISCAQLCGNEHAKMRGYLVVEDEDSFYNWLASQNPKSGRKTASDFPRPPGAAERPSNR